MKNRLIIDFKTHDDIDFEGLKDVIHDFLSFDIIDEFEVFEVDVKCQDEYCLEEERKIFKKSSPKSPVYGYDEHDFVICPICDNRLCHEDDLDYIAKPNYCEKCGQKLKWD